LEEMQRLELDPSVHAFRARASAEDHASKVDLNVCMAMFTLTEKLAGDAAVYCSACKTHEDATKTLELYSTPPLLVLHLKRLMPDAKLFTEVRFPLRGFDPSPFLAREGAPAADAAADNAAVLGKANSPSSHAGGVAAVAEENDDDEEKSAATGVGEEDVGAAGKHALQQPLGTAVDAPVASKLDVADKSDHPEHGEPVRSEAVHVDLPTDDQLAARVDKIVNALNSANSSAASAPDVAPSTAAPPAAESATSPEQSYRVEVTQAAGAIAAPIPVRSEPAASSNPPSPIAALLAAPKASAASPSPSERSPSPSLSPSPTPCTPHGGQVPARSTTTTPSVATAAPATAAAPLLFTPVAGGFDASVSAASLAASKRGKGKSNGDGSRSSAAPAGDVYDLYAVVNHHGALGGGGHYTVYALAREQGQWFHFDDHRVTAVPEERVVSSSAYMLFYEKRGLAQTAGADACPLEVRTKPLDAAARRVLRSTDGDTETCASFCAMQ
jgi:hypothetical protein